MNVVLVGQKHFAVEILLQCLDLKLNVLKVIVPHPDDRLVNTASENNIPYCVQDKKVDDLYIPDNTDIILCAYAHSYITKGARDKSKLGAVGYHPSLLPLYKGKNAVQDAIASGATHTGGSLYLLDDGWDTGSIIAQEACPIPDYMSAYDLWINHLSPIGVKLFKQFLTEISRKHFHLPL